MTVDIARYSRAEIKALLCQGNHVSRDDEAKMDQCLALSQSLYVGHIDGKLICLWGLIPPTLLSTRAYLWLYTTAAVRDHEFIFVRRSQRAIELLLEEYPAIYGHVHVGHPDSIRWLKWLGAEFSEPDGKLIPFVIRKKQRG